MEGVTFREAVRRATERNPSVGEAAQAILRAEGLLEGAKSVFKPTLYGDVSTTILDAARGFGGNITQPRTQYSFNGTVTYPFLAAERWARKNQAADQVEIANLGGGDTPPGGARPRRPTWPSSPLSATGKSRCALRHGPGPCGLCARLAGPGQPAQPRARPRSWRPRKV